MESIEMMAKEVESEKDPVEKIPAEISGLLDVVKMLTDKVDALVAAYAVEAVKAEDPEEVEVIDEDETEEVTEE